MGKETRKIANRINDATSIDELNAALKDIPKSEYCQKLEELCKKHGVSMNRLCEDSGLSRSLFFSSKGARSNHKNYRKPQKRHLVIYAVLLGLTPAELDELLVSAGMNRLFVKLPEDGIITYALNNKLTLQELEEQLEEKHCDFRLKYMKNVHTK